jgi:DNA-binding transcriptional regulator YbjK
MTPRPASRRHGPVMKRQTSGSCLEVAFRLLAEGGVEAVTVANLCEALGVTKGSFYYYFYNLPDFLEAFVEQRDNGSSPRSTSMSSSPICCVKRPATARPWTLSVSPATSDEVG